jgi:FtsP/CotA-like multicopper oxidase with cupredoxin domain
MPAAKKISPGKKKKETVVHLTKIKGYWKHFFITCFFILFIWFLLSPYADTNPPWSEPTAVPNTEGELGNIYGIKGIPHRTLMITKSALQTDFLVNGKKQPEIYLRPGQTVRFSVINATEDVLTAFAISGYRLYVISWNGNPFDQIIEGENVTISPGKHVQFLFVPKWYGRIPVTSSGSAIATIQVQGLPMMPSPLPIKLRH